MTFLAEHRSIRVVSALLFLFALTSASLMAGNADARIKPKTGIYYQGSTSTQLSGYVNVAKGKIVSMGGTFKFRNNSGKPCVPKGLYDYGDVVSFVADAKRPAKPNRKNRFTAAVKHSPISPKLKGKVTGKMLSRNKVSLKFSLAAGTCKAKGSYKKAKYSPGG